MLAYKLTLNGQGGELDSCVVCVAADDDNGLREKLVDWLDRNNTVLADGDTILIQTVGLHMTDEK